MDTRAARGDLRRVWIENEVRGELRSGFPRHARCTQPGEAPRRARVRCDGGGGQDTFTLLRKNSSPPLVILAQWRGIPPRCRG